MRFDPKKSKRELRGFLIDLHRKASLAEAMEEKSMANYGKFMLDCAVECFLVGFFDIGHELTLKARVFFRASIEHKEPPKLYGRELTEIYRRQGFALCNWLIHGQHDLKSLKQAAHWRDVWFEEHPRLARDDIQYVLTDYLEAELYETVVQRFEQVGATKPANLRRIQGEGTLCYAIARQRLGLEYTTEEIGASIDTFLKRRIPQWLGGDGHWTGAARWTKLAFWKKPDDPIATVLRCYDYLPGLKPPKYK
jgi:hypothetical protein